MSKLAVLFAALSFVLLSATAAPAAGGGTATEARAMLDRAVGELKANEAAALVKFDTGADGFKDRDLYVFCFDATTGIMTAHPRLKGTDIRTLKDSTGNAFGLQTFSSVKEGQVATVDYLFPLPSGGDPLPKQTFITRVGGQGCGVGYYK